MLKIIGGPNEKDLLESFENEVPVVFNTEKGDVELRMEFMRKLPRDGVVRYKINGEDSLKNPTVAIFTVSHGGGYIYPEEVVQ